MRHQQTTPQCGINKQRRNAASTNNAAVWRQQTTPQCGINKQRRGAAPKTMLRSGIRQSVTVANAASNTSCCVAT
jgi:hypothetical protein